MTLVAGTRLGPYEIVGALGTGGMGEVYRARDTKLDRDVAVKVLPESFATDRERLARFEREAKTLASLNDPNIAQVYGFESGSGIHALIMELVDGPTLAELIAGQSVSGRGQSPQGAAPSVGEARRAAGVGPRGIEVNEALPIARQIADALEAAHEQGIIHRDLKPANIKVRPDGTVKVLDFGLAKLAQASDSGLQASGDFTQSPTITSPATMTRMGTILGTAAYMSPEQAKGKAVDKRSDIWAFGCVLFEMLTGKRAFEGEDVSDTLAFIITKDVDWTALPPNTPAAIRRLLRRCLEKDRKRRLPDIAVVRLEIDEALTMPEAEGVRTVEMPGPSGAWLAWGVSALAIVVAVGAGIVATRPRATPDAPVIRLTVQPEGKNSISGYSLAVSPDGKYVAFVGTGEQGTQVLWVRSLDELSARPVPETAGATQPFWSPDSRSIGFFAGDSLKRVDLGGGAVQTLAPGISSPVGATWGTDGTIIFAPSSSRGFVRVQASGGGASVSARQATATSSRLGWPWFLPDGKHYLFSVLAPAANTGVYLGALDSSDTYRLADGTSNAAYAAGDLLFMRSNTLVSQPLDLTTFHLTGEPVTVAEGVRSNVANGLSQFGVSSSGVTAFRTGSAGVSQLAWLDRSGHQIATVGPVGDYLNPELSPDGKHLAFDRDTTLGNRDVWLLDLTREVFTRFTFDPAEEYCPIWSADGGRIAFASNRTGRFELYQKMANGAGTEKTLLQSERDKNMNDWSRDGRFILFRVLEPAGQNNMWVLPTSGGQKAIPFSPSPFTQSNGRVSPDGRWVAYQSNEFGGYQIVIQSFPAAGGKWQASTGGGLTPRWSRNGRELFYVATDGQMMAVPVSVTGAGSDAAPELGTPRPLFDAPLLGGFSTALGFRAQYDVAPDGQRFLVNLETGSADLPISVVVNWTAGLKK